MMIETREAVLAFIGAGSAILGLACFLVSITIAFKRVQEIERRIATPGKQLYFIKNTWQGGIVGRWIRAMHVAHFFFIRNVPRYGPVIAARMGDELEPVPRSLKLWAMVPVGSGFVLGVVFFIAGILL